MRVFKSSKIILIFILVTSILVGCNDNPPKPVAIITEVVVVEKRIKEYTRGSDVYYITVKKGESKVTFEVNKETHISVNEGTVISGEQYENNELKNITFPELK